MKTVKKIAVVIPCFNEAAGIAQVIRKIPKKRLLSDGFETLVYVVDNNSTDDTAAVAREAGAKVVYESKKGKGYALRAGFAALEADVDYVVMLDGDDTYSASEIHRMIEPLHSDFCDVVVGSRLGGHIQSSAMNTFNRFGNWLFTNAVRTVYRANVTDVLTGYFAWKKQSLDQLYPHLISEGFAIEMEMVTKMARMKLRLASVPVSYHPRAGESNLHPVRDGVRILGMFLRNLSWKNRATSNLRKLVFVSDSIYPYMKGGKEKRLHEITKRMVAMGYEVHIYTMHWWKTPEKEKIENGVHLHALSPYYEMYKGDRRTIKEGVLFGLACFKLLRVSFDVLDVDHMPFFPILSTWIVCKIRRVRFYGTWHEALSYSDWKEYMGRSGVIASIIEKISVRLPHTITAASEHTREKLATIHGRVDRVGTVASGIDVDFIRGVEPAESKTDILYVGRLVKDKNINVLIEAVRQIAKNHPSVHCTIIGDGVELKRLKAQVQKNALNDNVTFLKPLADAADIYAHMKAARVFCLPSSREGFSIVTLEALGCGTPVVTVDTPMNAAKRLVRNGKTGSVVECTPDAVAGAVSYWMSQLSKPETMAEAARYDWRALAEQQVKVYMS